MTQQTELCFYHWDATSNYLGIIIDLFNVEMQPYHLMMPANTVTQTQSMASLQKQNSLSLHSCRQTAHPGAGEAADPGQTGQH